MIVTIDGPAGAGKSTVARRLAERLGFRYLDTGAMYRAVALAALRADIPLDSAVALATFAVHVAVRFDGDRLWLDDEDVSEAIRSAEVTAATKYVADHPAIRERMVVLQREYAGRHDVVTEGRDQGTVVFPDAECKVYLSAAADVRAGRRLLDIESRGEPAQLSDVLETIVERDRADASRPVGPLRKPADAVEVATDHMNIDEVVERLFQLVVDAGQRAARRGSRDTTATATDSRVMNNDD